MTVSSGLFRFSRKEMMKFNTGLLIADAYKKDPEKNEKAHFFDESTRDNLIRIPDLKLFAEKYGRSFSDPYIAGYAAHLYADSLFFPEYVSRFISYADDEGMEAVRRSDVTQIILRHTGEKIPRHVFFSSEYIYGDYTRLNNYLMRKYGIECITPSVTSNIVREADAADIDGVITDLKRYLSETPSDSRLRVFNYETLEAEFERYTLGFARWYSEVLRNN